MTTEGGLNVVEGKEQVGKVVKGLSEAGVLVSLFIDPEADQIEMAAELGNQLRSGGLSAPEPTSASNPTHQAHPQRAAGGSPVAAPDS